MAIQDSGANRGTSVLGRLLAGGEYRAGPLLPGRPLALHAMLTSAGLEERTAGYDWHGLKRGSAQFCLFQYTLEGRGQLAWEGRRFTIAPGQAMLLWFPHDNRYWLGQGDRWRHFYLCLSGREVMRAWRSVVAKRGPVLDLAQDHPAVTAAAEACGRMCRGEVGDPFTVSALAYALAMALLAEAVGPLEAPSARHPGIEAAKALARSRFAENLGVTDLARAAGLSRHHFARLFAGSEGVAPSAYLAELRTRAAASLLRESGLTVSEVGRRCGFNDPAYFCRAFRRLVGVSPGEFRDSGMY